MPESVKDRCTKAHEYIFLLSKSPKYYYDYEAILEPATGYDGRKDTKYKGGPKDVSIGRHDRWRFSLETGKTGEEHSGYLNPMAVLGCRKKMVFQFAISARCGLLQLKLTKAHTSPHTRQS